MEVLSLFYMISIILEKCSGRNLSAKVELLRFNCAAALNDAGAYGFARGFVRRIYISYLAFSHASFA